MSVFRSLFRPVAAALTAVRVLGRLPKAGDYLITPNGDFLTDELGNRLTA